MNGNVSVDLSSAEFAQDPYPVLHRLREEAPVYRSATGSWLFTRYQDVLEGLSDPRLGNIPSPYAVLNARNRLKYTCADVANHILPFMDEPRHTHPRKLVSRCFHEHLKAQSPAFSAIASGLLRPYFSEGKMDLLHDFATPFTVEVMSDILGINAKGKIGIIKEWSDWFFYLFSIIPSESARQQLDEKLLAFREFFVDLIKQKSIMPDDGLISRLLQEREDSIALPDAELLDTCLLLMADGVNADHAISNAMLTLLQHPEQLQQLRDAPSLLPLAVDELLRYETPALFIGRIALQDIEWDGHLIRRNQGVLLMLGAANRDPSVFTSPDVLDLSRQPNPFLTFGKGQHTCIGRSLVRMMLQEAISSLLQAMNHIELCHSSPTWVTRTGHRWLDSLPVTFQAAHGGTTIQLNT